LFLELAIETLHMFWGETHKLFLANRAAHMAVEYGKYAVFYS
jgi:hypothetical protein